MRFPGAEFRRRLAAALPAFIAIPALSSGLFVPGSTAQAAPPALATVAQVMSIGSPNAGSSTSVDLGDQVRIVNTIRNTSATATLTIPAASVETSLPAGGVSKTTAPASLTLAPGQTGAFTTTMLAGGSMLAGTSMSAVTTVSGTPSECESDSSPCPEQVLGTSNSSSLPVTKTVISGSAATSGVGTKWETGPTWPGAIAGMSLAAYDPVNGRIWAVKSQGTLAEVRFLDLGNLTAGWQLGPQPVNQPLGSAFTYDPVNRRLWLLNGYGAGMGVRDTTEYLDLTNIAAGWRPGPSTKIARTWAGSVYDAMNERIWVSGSISGYGPARVLEYLDLRDLTSGWKFASAELGTGRRRANYVYDPVNSRLWSIGGYAENAGAALSTTEYLDLKKPDASWTPGPALADRSNASSAVYDPVNRRIWVTYIASPGAVQYLDLTNLTAGWRNGPSLGLTQQGAGGAVYDPANARIWFTEGYGQTRYFPLGGWTDVDGDGKYSAGDTIMLTLSIAAPAGNPSLTPETPANSQGKVTVSGTNGTLSAGGTAIYTTSTYTITKEDADAGVLRLNFLGSARRSGSAAGTPVVTTEFTFEVPVEPYTTTHDVTSSQLSIVSDGGDPGKVNLGEQVQHVIKVTNTGSATWSSLTVTPETGTGTYSCPQTVTPGAEATCSHTWTPAAADLKDGEVSVPAFTVTYKPQYAAAETSSTQPSVSIPAVIPAKSLSLAITARNAATGNIIPSGSAAVPAGTQVRFTYLVTNTGDYAVSIPVNGITARDGTPVTCPAVTLQPGGTTTCQSTANKIITAG